ncbi:MAG: HAMP domain-containing sensor histidine kinase, partial [Desulfotomaculaceae bacterium]
DKHGHLIAIEGIARDITDRKNAEEQITRLEESRRHLLSDISHDLRTPMTSIQGFVEALRDGVITDPNEKKKYLDVIHARVLGINRLMRDLFQLTNLEASQTTFNLAPVPIDVLMQNIYDRFAYEVKQKGLYFTLNNVSSFSDDTINGKAVNQKTPRVYIDVGRIDQVFTNLIGNALKHTVTGGTIKIGYTTTPGQKEVAINVSDTGLGISAQDIPRVFDRFYKASKSRNSAIGGSGLGLAICKELVKQHGGRIWIESNPGKGTAVFFSLPINQS